MQMIDGAQRIMRADPVCDGIGGTAIIQPTDCGRGAVAPHEMHAAERDGIRANAFQRSAATAPGKHCDRYSPLPQKPDRRERDRRGASALFGIVIDYDNLFEHLCEWIPSRPSPAGVERPLKPPR